MSIDIESLSFEGVVIPVVSFEGVVIPVVSFKGVVITVVSSPVSRASATMNCFNGDLSGDSVLTVCTDWD